MPKKPATPQQIAAATERLGAKWALPVIITLCDQGPLSYAGLRDAIPGIPEPTLSVRLRQLEEDNLITRTTYDTRPVSVRYELTPRGENLRAVIDAIDAWLIAGSKRRS